MIKLTQRGDFRNTEKFFQRVVRQEYIKFFKQVGEAGVKALRDATPKDTGKTADSWSYVVEDTASGLSITWTNSNVNKGANIAILIQYGHGTGTGGYVEGIDYINPALRPVFEAFANSILVEVSNNAYG